MSVLALAPYQPSDSTRAAILTADAISLAGVRCTLAHLGARRDNQHPIWDRKIRSWRAFKPLASSLAKIVTFGHRASLAAQGVSHRRLILTTAYRPPHSQPCRRIVVTSPDLLDGIDPNTTGHISVSQWAAQPPDSQPRDGLVESGQVRLAVHLPGRNSRRAGRIFDALCRSLARSPELRINFISDQRWQGRLFSRLRHARRRFGVRLAAYFESGLPELDRLFWLSDWFIDLDDRTSYGSMAALAIAAGAIPLTYRMLPYTSWWTVNDPYAHFLARNPSQSGGDAEAQASEIEFMTSDTERLLISQQESADADFRSRRFARFQDQWERIIIGRRSRRKEDEDGEE